MEDVLIALLDKAVEGQLEKTIAVKTVVFCGASERAWQGTCPWCSEFHQCLLDDYTILVASRSTPGISTGQSRNVIRRREDLGGRQELEHRTSRRGFNPGFAQVVATISPSQTLLPPSCLSSGKARYIGASSLHGWSSTGFFSL